MLGTSRLKYPPFVACMLEIVYRTPALDAEPEAVSRIR
jgi:hypothetical protein